MEKVEVRYVGGPLDGTTGEHIHPPPLVLRVTTARKPIWRGQPVYADDIEPGGMNYRLCRLPSGEQVYVVAGDTA